MSLDAILELEYESQHLGFHPRTFIDSVYNIFSKNLSQGLKDFKDFLAQEYHRVMPPNKIECHTDILLQAFTKKLDKAIDKLEVYFNVNIFQIPNHIVLPEDEVHIKYASTKEEDLKLNEEIKKLERKILEERNRSIALKKKILEQKYAKNVLFDTQEKLMCLLSTASAESISEENMNLIVSEVKALATLISENSMRTPIPGQFLEKELLIPVK